jgi:hypothetical protein
VRANGKASDLPVHTASSRSPVQASRARDSVLRLPAPSTFQMRGSPVALLRYAITFVVTVAVAWGLWQCQCPGQAVYPDGPVEEDGFVSTYPPSLTYTAATKHGWPATWLVRRATGDSLSRAAPSITYTTAFRELACDLVVWASILTCTAYTLWRATAPPAQISLRTLLWTHVAVAVLLCWWRVEFADTYVVARPALTELIRDAPTTPLLRLLKCPTSVSLLVLFGVFCVLLQVNTCLTGLYRLASASRTAGLSSSGE